MSHLILKKSGLGGKKCIISFWVLTGKDIEPKEHKWPDEWQPEHIDEHIDDSKNIAFPTASYWFAYPQFTVPRLQCMPLDNTEFGPGPNAGTWRHNFVPFMEIGKTDIPYRRVKWTIDVIRSDWWVYGHGNKDIEIISQRPHPAGDVGGEGGAESGGSGGGSGRTARAARAGVDTRDLETDLGLGDIGTNLPTDEDAAEQFGEGDQGIVPPSMFGMVDGKLRIILQCAKRAKMTGYAWSQDRAVNVTVSTPDLDPWLNGNLGPHIGEHGRPTVWHDLASERNLGVMKGNAIFYKDVSDMECGQHPETFVMDTGATVGDGKWHHVLLAFDLGGSGASTLEGGSAGGPVPLSEGDDGAAGGDTIVAEATGPPGPAPNPGPYGQYSGPQGEFALGGPANPGNMTEDVGEFGYADGGKISSKCKAWLMVDGENKTGKQLHHKTVWTQERATGLGDNDIVPVNALLAYKAEIRSEMITSNTHWEREYRGPLQGFKGPASRFEDVGEKRRLDYERPKYEFDPGALPWSDHPLAIPANNPDHVQNIIMAELHIWDDKAEDVAGLKDLFINAKTGEAEPPEKAIERLGKPSIQLHWSTNWKAGKNTGTIGMRETGEGEQKKKVLIEEGQFEHVGKIKRYLPDPELNKDNE